MSRFSFQQRHNRLNPYKLGIFSSRCQMRFRFRSLMTAGLVALGGSSALMAQGILVPQGGSINGNMAGTSTAVGCDAVGALFWNPAVISGMCQNEVTVVSTHWCDRYV